MSDPTESSSSDGVRTNSMEIAVAALVLAFGLVTAFES